MRVRVLGQDAPLSAGEVHYTTWERVWWSQEAEHFLDYIVSEDRDFREVLTAKYTVVNGPLAQFYRHLASGSWSNAGDLEPTTPEPLFLPSAVPALVQLRAKAATPQKERACESS